VALSRPCAAASTDGRVGVLESAGIETDQQAGVAVFKEVLHQLGWVDGRNQCAGLSGALPLLSIV